MRNQWSWRLLQSIGKDDTQVKVSQVIGKKDADGNSFYPLFDIPSTVVFMSEDKKTFETCKATADGLGNLTLTKRGLADDKTENEIEAFKKEWTPGTYMFATMGASDLLSLNEDQTWNGKQTFEEDIIAKKDLNIDGDINSEGDINTTGSIKINGKEVESTEDVLDKVLNEEHEFSAKQNFNEIQTEKIAIGEKEITEQDALVKDDVFNTDNEYTGKQTFHHIEVGGKIISPTEIILKDGVNGEIPLSHLIHIPGAGTEVLVMSVEEFEEIETPTLGTVYLLYEGIQLIKVYLNGNYYNAGGGGILAEPKDLSVVSATTSATITWTDPEDLRTIPPTAFSKSVLVRKIGSAPTSPTDGTIVVEEITRNQYKTNGYVDTGLTNGEDYYYRVFTYSTTGMAVYGDAVEIMWPRTFTMTFTETSSPSGFSPTYSDDATGLTAGSTEFDNFFGYSAVKLSTAGVETAEVKQNNGNLDITQLGTLTSGDNVMIKFPMLGVKMTKSGSTCTLSLTQKPNEPGYQYYAHTRGTTVKDQFYLGAYKSSGSTVMKSYSGQSPANNITIGNFRTYSQANGNGYDQIAIYQRMFVQALYMMKYGNPNSQSVIGRGYVDGNSGATTTGGTNSHPQASRGENTGKQQSKLFGLEDFRGNIYERVDGLWSDGSCYLWTNMNNTNFNDSGSGYTNTNIRGLVNGGGNITAISSTNNGVFLPISASGSDYEQYWCDYGGVYASRLADAGGSWSDASGAGAFRLGVSDSASDASTYVGSRLMFL